MTLDFLLDISMYIWPGSHLLFQYKSHMKIPRGKWGESKGERVSTEDGESGEERREWGVERGERGAGRGERGEWMGERGETRGQREAGSGGRGEGRGERETK